MITLWSNNVLLPTKENKQKTLLLLYPLIEKTNLEANTKIGYYSRNNTNDWDGCHYRTICLVILGFGIIYSENWDSYGNY